MPQRPPPQSVRACNKWAVEFGPCSLFMQQALVASSGSKTWQQDLKAVLTAPRPENQARRQVAFVLFPTRIPKTECSTASLLEWRKAVSHRFRLGNFRSGNFRLRSFRLGPFRSRHGRSCWARACSEQGGPASQAGPCRWGGPGSAYTMPLRKKLFCDHKPLPNGRRTFGRTQAPSPSPPSPQRVTSRVDPSVLFFSIF